MSREELYAHYKRTAPADDVAFFLRGYLSPAVRADALELAAEIREWSIARPDVYRRLTALQERWRTEDHWRRVVLPAERIARGLERARRRQPIRWNLAA